MSTLPKLRIALSIADPADRDQIYALRHDVYAVELGQHPVNRQCRLTDSLDAFNVFITAKLGGDIVGFISVTPPQGGHFSIDKYVSRGELPFALDEATYEIRLLTVVKPVRGTSIASLLMYAAFRWIESHGGTRVVAIGRLEVLDLYLKIGLRPLGKQVQSGAVHYELLTADAEEMNSSSERYARLLSKLARGCDWKLGIPFLRPAACYHGGRFFEAIGDEFDTMHKRDGVINADVLDAWFPPSPRVLEALRDHLPWIVRTSPPTCCDGVMRTIARVRGVEPANILPGGGSSDLIFLALREWLNPASRVLILDPMYGEYAHVLEKVIRCRVDRLVLSRAEGYKVGMAILTQALAGGQYDMVILVNPNSPTGILIDRTELEEALRHAHPRTRVWVDETYIEYAGQGQSIEPFAARNENVVVCKSMSKVYALSGVRAAYLCAAPHIMDALRPLSPPWAMGLPAQIAAVEALKDPEYYAARYAETHRLRDSMAKGLRELGMDVIPGIANFLLAHLPEDGLDAASFVSNCDRKNLFIRDASNMGTHLGQHAVRVAVKEWALNNKMIQEFANILKYCPV